MGDWPKIVAENREIPSPTPSKKKETPDRGNPRSGVRMYVCERN